jgi:hypothetical protein
LCPLSTTLWITLVLYIFWNALCHFFLRYPLGIMGKKLKKIIHFTLYNTLRRPHYQNKGPCKAQLRWALLW